MSLNICPICHIDFDRTDIIVIVKHNDDKVIIHSRKRGHYFHKECIQKWCKTKKQCPLDFEPIRSMHVVDYYSIQGLVLWDFDDLYELVDGDGVKLNNQLLMTIKNIDYQDHRGRTLVYCATQRKKITLVKKVIKMGADVNISNSDGFTPLMIATCNNSCDIVHILLKISDITKMDKKGYTAFEYACVKGLNNMVGEFLATEMIDMQLINYILMVHHDHFKTLLFGKQIENKLFNYRKLTDLN